MSAKLEYLRREAALSKGGVPTPESVFEECFDYIEILEARLWRQAQSLVDLSGELHFLKHGDTC